MPRIDALPSGMRPTRHLLPRTEPTPERHYLNRRQFLRQAGIGTIALASGLPVAGCSAATSPSGRARILRPGIERPEVLARFPAARNRDFDLEQKLTDEVKAATHNNFYEFLPGRASSIWHLTDRFVTDPWTIEVTGQCHKPGKFDIEDLFKFEQQEERTYRFRCVEAWAMDVPWTGFELNKLLARVEPHDDARFVKFLTVNRPDQMPGQQRTRQQYPWPYFEALTMAEAMNPLTLLATGIYGRPLPRQHGAPFRVIVPWKYGYKSPKSIVRIELVTRQPATFWQTLQPEEYPFLSNVNPKVPHPRWSQASEKMVGTRERRPTLLYNGYEEHVAGLYG